MSEVHEREKSELQWTYSNPVICEYYGLSTVVQDECSFVSLRDVERAMVVFKFFIDKMSLFKDLIAEKAKDEVRSIL